MIYTLVFITNNRAGVIRPDGTGEAYPEFSAPNQLHWRIGHVFPDGAHAMLWSQEPPRNPKAAYSDPDGGAFAKSHTWRYDLVTKTLQETEMAPYAGIIDQIPGEDRFLICENLENVAYFYTTDLDGRDRKDIRSEPGYAYGAALSPDGRKVAYHITSNPLRPGYEIYVLDVVSAEKLLIISDEKYIHFCPKWSPDGQWLLYNRCAHLEDPGHDRSDLWISRSDASEHRELITGQSHWFAASVGTPERHSSGSNTAVWSADGRKIAAALLLPDSQTAWPFQANRPDTDHFNRDYHPELARGGTQICLIDPETREIIPITQEDPPTWCFRPVYSPDGSQIAYMRADVGQMSELWVMNSDGSNQRFLTRGHNGTGADHARWVRLQDSVEIGM
jgi:Tol biopolymer transport system component